MHVFNKKQTGMHWQIKKAVVSLYSADQPNEEFPLAVALGGDRTIMLSGSTTFRRDDEFMFCSFLRARPLPR